MARSQYQAIETDFCTLSIFSPFLPYQQTEKPLLSKPKRKFTKSLKLTEVKTFLHKIKAVMVLLVEHGKFCHCALSVMKYR